MVNYFPDLFFTYLLHKFKTVLFPSSALCPPIYIMNSTVNTVSFKQKGNTSCFLALCWHRPIFPVRRQTSIFGSAELNFRVRNGYGWTLCDINTNFARFPLLLFCQHCPIFPVRRQTSIFGSTELNFRVRNGYGWTLCDFCTDFLGAPSGIRTRDPLIKSQLLYHLS